VPRARPPRRLDRDAVHTRVLDVLLRSAGPGVKPGILNRTAQRVAQAILRSSLTSKRPIHHGSLAALYRLNERDDPLSEQAILAVSRYVVRGKVMPVQRLRRLIDEARAAYLAPCPCRAAGRVQDLEARPAPTAADDALLERLLDAWADPAVRAATAPDLQRAFDGVADARRRGGPGGTLVDLERATWPTWEILLEHPGYDPSWIAGLRKNARLRPIHRSLLRAWVDALRASRKVVFTHMEAAGLPYAICTCPGPEADGGCILTNWHYGSGNDDILLPNETDWPGQRRDADGRVLPCDQHAARAGRPCLGCGCEHAGAGGPAAAAQSRLSAKS
jgi:hypothetical protein